MTERYESEIASVTRRLTETHLERMRSVAIGGASASTAIILVLLQVAGATPSPSTAALTLSLYAASFAIPAWLGAWQFLEAYIFYGRNSSDRLNLPRGLAMAAGFNFAGTVCLATSLSAAIWHLSPLASIMFIATGAVVGVLVIRHSHAIKAIVDAADQEA